MSCTILRLVVCELTFVCLVIFSVLSYYLSLRWNAQEEAHVTCDSLRKIKVFWHDQLFLANILFSVQCTCMLYLFYINQFNLDLASCSLLYTRVSQDETISCFGNRQFKSGLRDSWNSRHWEYFCWNDSFENVLGIMFETQLTSCEQRRSLVFEWVARGGVGPNTLRHCVSERYNPRDNMYFAEYPLVL